MKKSTKIILLFLLVGLCCSLFLNSQRHRIEQANKQVENVMEYGAIARLAQSEGLPVESVLQEFKARGITTLAVFDTTLEKLQATGEINLFTGRQLLDARELGTLPQEWWVAVSSPTFSLNGVYITQGSSLTAFKDVEEDLRLRFGAERIKLISTEPRIIAITGDLHKNYDTQTMGEQEGLMKLSLGVDTAELRLAKEMGFMVAARPINYVQPYGSKAAAPDVQIKQFFQRLDKSGAKVSLLMGSGKNMLGNKNYLPLVAKEMARRDITLAMPEGVTQLQFIPMAGMTDLAKVAQYKVARTYVIDFGEQRKMQVYDAFRRWALSDEERNIRVNYIKTFLSPRDGKTLLQTNLDYVERVTKSLSAQGYSFGKAGVFEAYFPALVALLPIAFAVMAGLFTYLGMLSKQVEDKKVILTIIFGSISSLCLMLTATGLTMRHTLALLSAVIFPVLTMSLVLKWWEQASSEEQSLGTLIRKTSLQLAGAVCLSLVGASFLAAILGDIRFFLELDIYRGVKLTFILPVLLTLLLFCKNHALWSQDDIQKNPLQRILLVLQQPFTLKMLLALGVLGFVAWVFVGRSGHTDGVPVPAIEIKLRLFLERVMYARPREKEFLIGHPAFFIAAYACAKKLPKIFYCLFTLGAVIGQGSLVQTFAHMRTPIMMSYIRAFDGLGLGLVLGIICLVIVYAVYPWLVKTSRRLGIYE